MGNSGPSREQILEQQLNAATANFQRIAAELAQTKASSDNDKAATQAEIQRIKQQMQEQKNGYDRDQAQASRDISELKSLIERPIKDRQRKAQLVNSLKIKISQTNTLALIGPKGAGKSTFLWLSGVGDEPKLTASDGTVEMSKVTKYLDTIGIKGWTMEDMLKTVVLMLYQGGLPSDLVIFPGSSRLTLPVSLLNSVNIFNPMLCILSNTFWQNYHGNVRAGIPKSINLLQDSQKCRKVNPVTDMYKVYELGVHLLAKDLALATPITHHENINDMMKTRAKHGIKPFDSLIQLLGGIGAEFCVPEVLEEKSSDSAADVAHRHFKEMLFQFIYIYETKYKNLKNEQDKSIGPIEFMNRAELREFTDE